METIYNVDIEMIDRIIDPDFELHSPVFPVPLKGIEEYKNFVLNTTSSFSSFNATIEDINVKRNQLWGRFTMEGTNTDPFGELSATGRKLKSRVW